MQFIAFVEQILSRTTGGAHRLSRAFLLVELLKVSSRLAGPHLLVLASRLQDVLQLLAANLAPCSAALANITKKSQQGLNLFLAACCRERCALR